MKRQKADVIPTSVRPVQNGGQLKSQTSIRVAAYCRVASVDQLQPTPHIAQKSFHNKTIMYRPEWEFDEMKFAALGTRKIRGNLKAYGGVVQTASQKFRAEW